MWPNPQETSIDLVTASKNDSKWFQNCNKEIVSENRIYTLYINSAERYKKWFARHVLFRSYLAIQKDFQLKYFQ